MHFYKPAELQSMRRPHSDTVGRLQIEESEKVIPRGTKASPARLYSMTDGNGKCFICLS